MIKSLKRQIEEYKHYEKYTKEELALKAKGSMKVVPVNLSTSPHKDMLTHSKLLLEKAIYLSINPKFDKLISSLRTAVDDEGSLDKEQTFYRYL